MSDNKLFISRDGADGQPAWASDANPEAALQHALASDEERLGPDHPDVGIHLNNLAALLLAAGRAQEALPLAVRARDIMLGGFDGDHPMKRATYDTLVAVVRQVDAEGAAPPNLRPFAAQIRAMDAAAGNPQPEPVQAPPLPEPVRSAAPELAPITVAPIAPPAPAPSPAPASAEPEVSVSPLAALGAFIFGARPPRRS